MGGSKSPGNRIENNTKDRGKGQLNESLIDMNPGLDTTMAEHARTDLYLVSADTPAKIAMTENQTTNNLVKQPKSKSSKKKTSSHSGGHGDANKQKLPLNEEARDTEDGKRIARNMSQSSLNSTARSPKALIATRKALSVRDTFKENAAKKYVKASRCTRMIPF